MTDFTLSVPDDLYQRVEHIARQNGQSIERVFLDHLRLLADSAPLLKLDEEAELQALHYLSDDALWTIAAEQMTPDKKDRLQALMARNSSGDITREENAELEELVERGQMLMLRKSEAAALLTQRGYVVTKGDMANRE